MESNLHAPEEFTTNFGSKLDLYNLLTIDLGYYLPTYKRTSFDFLRQIIAKKKKVLNISQVKFVTAPKYPELGVAKLWNFIKEIEELTQYFPDFKENEYPERKFLWPIIATLRPEATKKIIGEARKNRSIKCEENKEELVEVDPEIFNEIKKVFLQKVHTGRAPFMLKRSAKLKRSRAQPKEYRADFQSFRIQDARSSARSEVARRNRESTYSTQTIEMTGAQEEEKENRAAAMSQRFAHSRRD